MPWKVEKDTKACPVGKPWAVKNTQTGTVNGRCHETKAKAVDQQKAMYASYRREGKSVSAVEEYPQIVRAITGTPWLIVPENGQAILDIVNMRLNGNGFSDEEIATRLAAAKENNDHENPRIEKAGGVGLVSLYGPIFPKANLMTQLSGATSLETFQVDLQELLADDSVKQIVIDYNSPGGTADMVHETGTLIRQSRDIKPIYGIANTMAGSAALWLLAQSTKAYSTPSGKVGSLGVYTAHEDRSAEDAKLGRKITLIHAGKFKTAGSPHEALTDEARAYLQEMVDEQYQEFVDEVAIGRGMSARTVEDNFGQGKLLMPAKAKEVGMVDEVISMRDLLDGLVAHNYSSDGQRAVGSLSQSVSRMHALFSEEGGLFKLESKEMEHSEPGTGNPPAPRTDQDGSDDPAYTEGWRRPTPPPQDQPSGTSMSSINNSKGGGDKLMNDTQLEELRRLFKLDVDADADSILEAAKLQHGELLDIKRGRDLEAQKNEFQTEYPLVWDEHQQLMAEQRQSRAETFVGTISRALKAEGMGFREARLGLSTRAKDAVTELHVKLAADTELQTQFETVMKTVMKGGLVPFGEQGSSKKPDEDPEFDNNTPEGIAGSRQHLAGLINKYQAEHPGTDYRTAMAAVMQAHPDLAQDYRDTRVPA